MPSVWRAALIAPLVESLLLSRSYHYSFSGCLALLGPFHLFLVFIWSTFLWPFVFSPLRKLPEPEGGSWLHGHKHLIPDVRSGFPQNEWVNDIPNDGLIRYRMKYNAELLLVTSPKALSEVLVQKNYDFAKPRSLRLGLGRILGVGLIVADGNEHKTQRRQLMPAFAHRHIKNLYPVFWRKSVQLAEKLSLVVSQDATDGNEKASVVDLPNWIARTTLDIIGVAGMGQDFHAIDNPDNEVCNAYNSVFERPPPKSKLVIAKLILEELLSRVLPIQRSDSIAAASNALKAVGRRLIQQKEQIKSETGELDEKDIISVALESGAFTQENLVNQILTFLAAGHETTATTITWATVALTQNPSVQQKLRAEVQEKLPSFHDLTGHSMTSELLDSMPYLHAVCNEVLRLYPPAGLTKRTAAKDTTILGQFVPAGTDVIVGIRAINHSRELWGQDAMDFNPDRWLGSGNWNSGGSANNFAFMTFLHGPRSCIGQSFAKAEFAILLAVLVATFEIEMADPNIPVRTETGLTTRPKGGLKVRLKLVS